MRRSRDRFWRPVDATTATGAGTQSAPPDDKQDAYDTLHTVLETLCRVAAPFLPFLSEAVYKGLTKEPSVHLRSWPEASELPAEPELVEAMDLAREVCSAGHSIRKATHIRARLPLSSLTVAAPGAGRLAPYADLIADEVNVQEVKLLETVGDLASTVLNVVPAALGVLRWLTCPAAALCVATSNRAITNLKSIDVTHNGGATWTSRYIGTMNVLYAASCASTTTCEFVGEAKDNDALTATTVDRGATWPLRPLTALGHGRLWSISCAARSHCVAVGQWWTYAPSDGGPLLLSD